MLTKGYLVGKIDKKKTASSKKDTIFGGNLKQIFGPSYYNVIKVWPFRCILEAARRQPTINEKQILKYFGHAHFICQLCTYFHKVYYHI